MATEDGDGISRIILYGGPGFTGESQTIMESLTNARSVLGEGKKIASFVIQGNPWLFYPDEQMKGSASLMEEGRYSETESLSKWVSTPGSIKFVSEDLGNPELLLVSSTNFDGKTPEWTKADASVKLMKTVSVGYGGIWAVNSKDDSVWCRYHEDKGKAVKKVQPDTGMGDGWSKIQGALRQISVGFNSAWGVTADGRVLARIGIGDDSPTGREWSTVDADQMKHVSVSNNGHVWGIDHRDKIWYRKGANNQTILGSNWKSISGNLKQISVGHCGVWGVNSEQSVFYRLNSYGDPDNEGTGWVKIEGKFQQIYSGSECVLALAGNRDVYYRANIFEREGKVLTAPNHEGTHWVRIEQEKESKIIFKWVECGVDTMWGVDKDNTVWYKNQTNPDLQMQPHYTLTTFGDLPEFFDSKFPNRASTYRVNCGGWALYSEPFFKGKVMFHYGIECLSNDPPSREAKEKKSSLINNEDFSYCNGNGEAAPYESPLGDDLVSNDPPNKENPLKSFFVQIGSARPMRGQNYRTPIIRVLPMINELKINVEEKVLFTQEVKNESETFSQAPWDSIYVADLSVNHRFQLKNAQNIPGCGINAMKGCTFFVEKVDPIKFKVQDGPNCQSGEEFHYQMENEFIFVDETNSSRGSGTKRVLKLPPRIPPRSILKVKVTMYKGKFTAPVKADFKIGFNADFDRGSESWQDGGTYIGEDATNVKIEVFASKLPSRKVSKMLNGLGNDM